MDILKDETVDTALLSGILKTNSLLTDIDVQDIDTERINRQCEKAALLVLIDRVVTFHPDSWYKNFLECLWEAGMEGAVKKINPDFGNTLIKINYFHTTSQALFNLDINVWNNIQFI